MLAKQSLDTTRDWLIPEGLNPRGLVLMPLLVRILALVTVMLLANIP